MKLGYSVQIFKNTQITNFMKILPVGAKLFHADRHNVSDDRFASTFRWKAEERELSSGVRD
jgi:5'(3')-deoxyribonucleotidase